MYPHPQDTFLCWPSSCIEGNGVNDIFHSCLGYKQRSLISKWKTPKTRRRHFKLIGRNLFKYHPLSLSEGLEEQLPEPCCLIGKGILIQRWLHSYQVKTGVCCLANCSREAGKQCKNCLPGQIVINVV